MEKSSELFNPNSEIFRNSITGTTIILVILVVGGLLFEYGYLRPRHRMIESAKSKSVLLHNINVCLSVCLFICLCLFVSVCVCLCLSVFVCARVHVIQYNYLFSIYACFIFDRLRWLHIVLKMILKKSSAMKWKVVHTYFTY